MGVSIPKNFLHPIFCLFISGRIAAMNKNDPKEILKILRNGGNPTPPSGPNPGTVPTTFGLRPMTEGATQNDKKK
jgi:hypothetical protein